MSEFNCSKCGPITSHNNGRCLGCGRVLKGFSLSGHIVKAERKRQQSEAMQKLDSLLKTQDFEGDPVKALTFLLNTASTREELFRYSKELMPYYKPKLSSIKNESKEDKTITIEIIGLHAEKQVTLIDVNSGELQDVMKDIKAVEDSSVDANAELMREILYVDDEEAITADL